MNAAEGAVRITVRKLQHILLILLLISLISPAWGQTSSARFSDQQLRKKWAERLEIRGNNPDSAEVLGRYALKHFTEANDYLEIAEAHLYLSEIYQYRKSDILKAFDHILGYLRVLTDHPELRNTNPYIFVNIGNLLLANNLPGISIAMYRQGLVYADKKTYPGARITLLQNIAKVYRGQQQFDSSRYYFSRAAKELAPPYTMVEAQQLYSLSRLKYEMKDYDSAYYFANATYDYLKVMKEDLTNRNNPSDGTDKHLCMEYLFAAKLMQGDAMSNMGKYTDATKCYDSAMYYARASGPDEYPFTLFIQTGYAAAAQSDPDKALTLADSAMSFAIRKGNNEMKAKAARLYSSGYMLAREEEKANEYRKLAGQFEATATNILRPDSELTKRLEITSAALGTQLDYLNTTRSLNLKTIRKQQLINRLLGLLLILIITGGTIIYFTRKRIESTRFALGRRTAENIRIAEQINSPRKQVSKAKIISVEVLEKLEPLFLSKKPYTDPEISLGSLARMLDTNKTYLSTLLNLEYGMNFNEYVNEWRVKEACRIIMNDGEHRLSYEQIQGMVGFGSKSTFYVSFKNYTGLNPAEYRKNLDRKS